VCSTKGVTENFLSKKKGTEMTTLKHCLVDHPEPAYRVAQKAGMPDSRLSKIALGIISSSGEEKANIAKALRKPVSEVFPESEEVVTV